MRERYCAVYIMANKRNGTLYTGVTSNLIHRINQHKTSQLDSFTKRYNCKILVYFEPHSEIVTAIEREKQIKKGSRKKKLILIESMNPKWIDLSDSLF